MAFLLPIDEFLRPQSPKAPCGTPDAATEAQVGALADLVKRHSKPQVLGKRRNSDGQLEVEEKQAASEPDWQRLVRAAETLFRGGKVKDLSQADQSKAGEVPCQAVKHLEAARILTFGSLMLETSGLPGFADGLALFDGLFKTYWNEVLPTGDETDPDEPYYQRTSIIASLGEKYEPASSAPWRLAERLYRATLIDSDTLGKFSLRDCLFPWATEFDLVLPDGGAVSAETIREARLTFADGLETQKKVLLQAVAATEGIEQTLTDKAGVKAAPDLDGLRRILRAAISVLDGQDPAPISEKTALNQAGKPISPVSVLTKSGPPASRDAAVRAISEAADYFRRHEPSSPIPLLLDRAKRMAGMNFLQLLGELKVEQDVVENFKKLAGEAPVSPDESAPADAQATEQTKT